MDDPHGVPHGAPQAPVAGLTDEDLAFFHENGYLVVRGVVPGDRVGKAANMISRLCATGEGLAEDISGALTPSLAAIGSPLGDLYFECGLDRLARQLMPGGARVLAETQVAPIFPRSPYNATCLVREATAALPDISRDRSDEVKVLSCARDPDSSEDGSESEVGTEADSKSYVLPLLCAWICLARRSPTCVSACLHWVAPLKIACPHPYLYPPPISSQKEHTHPSYFCMISVH